MTRTTQYVDAFWVSVETGFLFVFLKPEMFLKSRRCDIKISR